MVGKAGAAAVSAVCSPTASDKRAVRGGRVNFDFHLISVPRVCVCVCAGVFPRALVPLIFTRARGGFRIQGLMGCKRDLWVRLRHGGQVLPALRQGVLRRVQALQRGADFLWGSASGAASGARCRLRV